MCMWGEPGMFHDIIKIGPEFLEQNGNISCCSGNYMFGFNARCV